MGVSLVVGILGAGSSAFACSYYINNLTVGNDLAANALTHLGVSINDMTDVSATQLRFWESISTPMCPEEMTYEAQIAAVWMGPAALRPTVCSASVRVTKVEPWGIESGSREFYSSVSYFRFASSSNGR